ncbi:flagellar L-ring protein precursor FlgH [Rhodobacter aestuarii]|uniref:Flagellar L-ring protein n=1 Tax=Rhodobacter aestuarii TaxID=453582 RepID=A0A1N7LLI9_9RHOB|nr:MULTISPECIES: flagellar basal body L-ring protein FlgH [Rhodobacter]PTV95175.1 flagellar L-ring protein precursor FlgH [Rhodobacter aestuarii]SIS74686.1 flagellar L-ring protein precursor FlgH [Rhodobacter aestuarii]SOC07658.1 flagellar L-ring protein precursor FlgH [Rhodobacter sp. JA431]
MRPLMIALLALSLANCGRIEQVGKAPEFNPVEGGNEFFAMTSTPMPDSIEGQPAASEASLWSGNRGSLLGDRRAASRGDILTVVIEIDDSAQISNSTGRNRSSSDTMGVPSMMGIPQRLDARLPEGATTANAYETGSSSSYSGDGTVARNEKLTLRVAATVLDRLPNGVLRIQGVQEVRVNFEVRELVVTGFVRPEDVSRQNEITYDKIAGARISYGGRGQITDVQQPRYGQQIADILLPF